MPHYNLKTKQIVGCKPTTLAWWHEDRHKQQHEAFPIIEKLFSISFMVFLFTIIIVTNNNIVAILPIFLLSLVEADAWGYSIGMWLRERTKTN